MQPRAPAPAPLPCRPDLIRERTPGTGQCRGEETCPRTRSHSASRSSRGSSSGNRRGRQRQYEVGASARMPPDRRPSWPRVRPQTLPSVSCDRRGERKMETWGVDANAPLPPPSTPHATMPNGTWKPETAPLSAPVPSSRFPSSPLKKFPPMTIAARSRVAQTSLKSDTPIRSGRTSRSLEEPPPRPFQA